MVFPSPFPLTLLSLPASESLVNIRQRGRKGRVTICLCVPASSPLFFVHKDVYMCIGLLAPTHVCLFAPERVVGTCGIV